MLDSTALMDAALNFANKESEQYVLPFGDDEPHDISTESSFTFDPILRQLVNEPDKAPLVVKRFREWSGCSNSVQAIQKATTELLFETKALPTEKRPFVSISALCKHLNICVRSTPSKRSSKRCYSLSAPPLRGKNLRGDLEMTPSGPVVTLPNISDHSRARFVLAHEVGHLLLLHRGSSYDAVSLGLPSTPEEEALAEYAARLLLLPLPYAAPPTRFGLAKGCVYNAGERCVTINAAVRRLQDINSFQCHASPIQAAILWRMASLVATNDQNSCLTPQWFICPNFIPVGRCRARTDSLIATLGEGESRERPVEGEREESVSIGSLNGKYHVSAFAWGSISRGTRLVLSLFSASK